MFVVLTRLPLCGVAESMSALWSLPRFDSRYSYDWVHQNHPEIALVASEGSSCDTQRGVNVVNMINQSGQFTTASEWDDVFNADCLSAHFCPQPVNQSSAQNEVLANGTIAHSPGSCLQSWTMTYHPVRCAECCFCYQCGGVVRACMSLGCLPKRQPAQETGQLREYMAGNLGVWTLFDYLGEPSSTNRKVKRDWPQVSVCKPEWADLKKIPFGCCVFPLLWFAAPLKEDRLARGGARTRSAATLDLLIWRGL